MKKLFGILAMMLCLSCGEEPIPLGLQEPDGEHTQQQQAVLNPLLTPDPEEEPYQHAPLVMVYYRHPLLEGLIPCQQQLFKHSDPLENITQVVNLLSIPPKDGQGIAIWPDNTQIRELYLLEDGTLVIDFDQAFIQGVSAGASTEEFMVFSLVNSVLENFQDLNQVRLLINGEVKETFLGHVDIEFPLKINRSIYTVQPEVPPDEEIVMKDLGPPPEQPREEDLN